MCYRRRETYTLMIQASMLQAIPRIKEGIASTMTTPYKILLPVKRHILCHTLVQFEIELVSLHLT